MRRTNGTICASSVEDGEIEIDNGLSERLIRTIAIGTKHFLFAGSDAAAKKAAITCSLIASSEMVGADCGALAARRADQDRLGLAAVRIGVLVPGEWVELHAQTAPATQEAA